MEEVLMQSQIALMDKPGNVVLDIESLTQPSEKCCSGSPKVTRALSRKGSCRMERRIGEEQEADETTKKLVIKVVPSQLEQSKQPSVPNKALGSAPCVANNPMLADSGDVRNKRFNRITTIHPRKILLLFATIHFLFAEFPPTERGGFRIDQIRHRRGATRGPPVYSPSMINFGILMGSDALALT